MLAFLPVSRFRVSYQVASGRPYSAFERFLLEAVRDGAATLDALVDLFCVHRRIVIEGLVTLMQAGWLGLLPGDDHMFEVTDAGREALTKTASLPESIALAEKTALLVMEGVRGQIAPSHAVTFWDRRKLATLRDQGVKIPKSDVNYAPETGQVRPLLRTKAESAEYVRGIGPIQFDRHNADYLVVEVDVANRRLVGVPGEWEGELVDELVERVQRHQAELNAKGAIVDDKELRKLVRLTREEKYNPPDLDIWRMPQNTVEFVSGIDAHSRLLIDCLCRASSCVVISSAVLARIGINDLLRHIVEAVTRGVLIDILWGWQPDPARAKDHEEALKMLLDLQKHTRSMPVRGRLQIAAEPSQSNVAVLVADPAGEFEVTLGCCEWLAGRKGANALSIRLTHAGLVSRLCGLVADLIAADAHLETSASALQLLNASSDLDARSIHEETASPDPENEDVEARLLLDRQHELIVRAAATVARKRLILSSRRWGVGAPDVLTALRRAVEGGCQYAQIHYGIADKAPASALETKTELMKLGVTVTPAAEPIANFAVLDDWVLLTSQDLLMEPRPGARPRLADLGIALRGTDIGNRLFASMGHTPKP